MPPLSLVTSDHTAIEHGSLRALPKIDIEHIAYSEMDKLGEGSYANVYMGEYGVKTVAIKVSKLDIKPRSGRAIDAEGKERWRRAYENEIRFFARVQHPNIITALGYTDGPTYCLVMEYAPLGSLGDYIKERKIPIDWDMQGYALASSMAQAVQYLHSAGIEIIHADIKSANVLLFADHDTEDKTKATHAKLVDFGLALTFDEALTAKGNRGSLIFRAPETMMKNPKLYPASDVFSLGMTFWEMASGEDLGSEYITKLVTGNSDTKTHSGTNDSDQLTWAKRIVSGMRPEIPNQTPQLIQDVIRSCWARRPEHRIKPESIVIKLASALESERVSENPSISP